MLFFLMKYGVLKIRHRAWLIFSKVWTEKCMQYKKPSQPCISLTRVHFLSLYIHILLHFPFCPNLLTLGFNKYIKITLCRNHWKQYHHILLWNYQNRRNNIQALYKWHHYIDPWGHHQRHHYSDPWGNHQFYHHIDPWHNIDIRNHHINHWIQSHCGFDNFNDHSPCSRSVRPGTRGQSIVLFKFMQHWITEQYCNVFSYNLYTSSLLVFISLMLQCYRVHRATSFWGCGQWWKGQGWGRCSGRCCGEPCGIHV